MSTGQKLRRERGKYERKSKKYGDKNAGNDRTDSEKSVVGGVVCGGRRGNYFDSCGVDRAGHHFSGSVDSTGEQYIFQYPGQSRDDLLGYLR